MSECFVHKINAGLHLGERVYGEPWQTTQRWVVEGAGGVGGEGGGDSEHVGPWLGLPVGRGEGEAIVCACIQGDCLSKGFTIDSLPSPHTPADSMPNLRGEGVHECALLAQLEAMETNEPVG